ncbi:tagaturonate reductase [Ferruginibacter sp. SUN106]|uniref:tagaturonate reductase n=1 Tax=Ferruginibacter sp. SUN106 TaxID=2978348 RepID=UPI003D36999F
MTLSKFTLKNIQGENVPDGIFDLPEKVLQFGTGVLLRGLPDYFIDKANRQGIFNGRIVVVKSTSGGDAAAFEKQDGLYTLCIRGLEDGKTVSENIICSAISRVLSAKDEWDAILKCAHNPDMEIIVSNTTEVGIELVKDDIKHHPPISYPGKLLAFLYERYKAFDGSDQCGMVIVPTELISDNGKKLEAIVLELAHLNGLEENFIEWLEKHNHFCNSLVDRIVPGKPAAAAKKALEDELGYTDDLITMSEVYSLWAIEGNEAIASVLSFAQADKGVVITPDIHVFKELKLRLLNGTHSLSCAIAFLSGIVSVKEAMDNPVISNFVKELMTNEIAKAIPYELPQEDAQAFAGKVLDRFRNPSIEHHWINISLNYTSKLEMRIAQVLLRYAELYKSVPENMALGFAAYLVFMKAVKLENDIYYGNFNGADYPIKDPKAGYFFEQWKNYPVQQVVKNVLSNATLWNADLSAIPGFAEKVTEDVEDILQYGMLEVIQNEKVKI